MADEPQDEPDPKKGKKKKKRGGGEDDAAVSASSPAAIAGMASCLTGIVLLLLVLGAALTFWLYSEQLPFELSWGPGKIALILVLLIVIPIVVFRAVTLWIMGAGPRFADIEFSWRAGIEAMAKQGITLKSAPLFMIVGGGSEKLRRNMMAASGLRFRVSGVPDRPAPLHWYATGDAIYLFLDDAAWTNLAARQYRSAARAPKGPQGAEGPPQGKPMSSAAMATIMPGSVPDQPAEPGGAGGLLEDEFPSELPGAGSGPRPAPAARQQAAYLGTLSPEQVAAATTSAAASPKPSGGPPPRKTRRAASDESSRQLRRLEAVCSKLRRYRQPVCPLNGMLVLLPFDLLQAGRADIEEVERAISADLATSQRELQVRFPVTALVVAMEQERGFCELIRRIGREGAARQRFGQRFDMRIMPNAEELQRFSLHVCGVFEQWVYTLFREDRVLSHPGNPALYNLLCKVRRSFQARLSDVLSKGFGQQTGVEHLLFSGCYFAATGSKPERQAFVSGILNKLRDEQEDLDWTGDALKSNGRRGLVAVIGWAVVLLLVAVLVAIFVLGGGDS